MPDESPLIEGAKNLYRKFQNTAGDPAKESGHKVDPSGHAEMVKEANESFRKPPSKPADTKKKRKPYKR